MPLCNETHAELAKFVQASTTIGMLVVPMILKPNRFVRTPKGSLFLVLGALFVIATPAMGLDRVLPQVLAALAAAWSIEMIIGYGVRRIPTSALLSGLIVSLVLSPHQEWFAAWATTAAAVGSKYLLRYRGRHIFNPSNLGLVLHDLHRWAVPFPGEQQGERLDGTLRYRLGFPIHLRRSEMVLPDPRVSG